MATGFNTQVGNGEYRLQFETDSKEYYLLMQETARRCIDGAHITNADRIRGMSDEELAEFIVTNIIELRHPFVRDLAYSEWLKWLQQPAEEDENDSTQKDS